MQRPPDVQTTLPTSFVRSSITRKLLTPLIVLLVVVFLGLAGLLGIFLSIVVLSSSKEKTGSVESANGFSIVAGACSIIYLILHTVAARTNDPVGTTRPPELQLHGACFVIARLGLISWFGAFVAGCVVLSKEGICGVDEMVCRTRVVSLVGAVVGFVANGVILTALETCRYPFEVPNFLHLQKRLKYQVSAFAEDLLNVSVSRSPSYKGEKERENERETGKGKASNKNVVEKPLPKPPSEVSDISPGRFIRPSRTEARTSKGWGEEWTHLVQEMKEGAPGKPSTKSSQDSGISLTYDSSSGYVSSSERSSHTRMSSYGPTHGRSIMNEGSTYITFSRQTGIESNAYGPVHRRASVARRPRPRGVTPSSSISNISRRSPLATMRSAEFPERIVRPDLRYYPPRMRTHNSWVSPRSSMSALVPIADVPRIRRTSAIFPGELEILGPSKILPPLPSPESSGSPPRRPIKRRTADLRVPAAFPQSEIFDIEQSLDNHMRKIEVEFVTRRNSKATYSDVSIASPRNVLMPLSNNQARRTDKMERRASLSRTKSELGEKQTTKDIVNASQIGLQDRSKDSRYRQGSTSSSGVERTTRFPRNPDSIGTKNTALQGHTTPNVRPGTAQPVSKVEQCPKEFRRLSLGDISSGFDGLFR